ncbi:hypothetical protein [Burkholderia sp. S171]|nr:hypothetical protein [Burkholderia sp. S171]
MLTPRSGVHVPPTLDIVNYEFPLRDNYDGRRDLPIVAHQHPPRQRRGLT